jgi:hypothetical protein
LSCSFDDTFQLLNTIHRYVELPVGIPKVLRGCLELSIQIKDLLVGRRQASL